MKKKNPKYGPAMDHFFKSDPHEYTEIGLFILFENNGLFWAQKGICKFIEKCMGFFFFLIFYPSTK